MDKNTEERPVSWSEIAAWSTCREKWRWTYEVGIVPRRMERAPSIGSCGHAAIAAVLRGKSWKKAINEWLEAEIGDRELFDEELAEYQEVHDTTHGIITRYLDRYPERYKPVLVEQKFEIPIRGMKAKLIGYWDAIVEGEDGKLWLLEHKFPARFRTDENLELDGQIGVYQYAAHRLGFKVVGTIYNQLLARLPAKPKINKDGSVSRAKVYTDWKTYCETLREEKQDPGDYSEMEEKLSEYKFFQRNYLYRPRIEIQTFARDMEHRIWDMRRKRRHIYRSESYINCGRCPYRELCLESLKGGDVDYIIENEFEPKTSRKKSGDTVDVDYWLTNGPDKEGDK